ncbi:S26 family signal peptidase [Poriferisphaera corsica]
MGMLICCLIIFGSIMSYFQISYSYTGSLPCGIYRGITGQIKRGSYVSFDPKLNDRIECFLNQYAKRGASKIWMKKVVGMPGDLINIDEMNRVTVNGQGLDGSNWFPIVSRSGIPMVTMPHYPIRLGDHEVFVLGTDPKSLDSRFFGPVPLAIITEINEPLFVFSSEK